MLSSAAVKSTLRGTAVRQNAWAPGLGTSRRIHNGATSTGTERFAKRILAKGSINHEFNETSHGWKISSIGFGGYRVREKVPQHKAAIMKAIECGVNLFDTSANFIDGSSERIIGQTIDDLITRKIISRDEIVITTKAGTIQGPELESAKRRLLARGSPAANIPEVAPRMGHSIHPDFILDQLDQSLKRLNVSTIDYFLIQSPEVQLSANSQDLLYRQMAQAFEVLEDEVKKGRIQFYGVSTTAFTRSPAFHNPIEIDGLLANARRISASHHFRVVEYPMNLIETEPFLSNSQLNCTTSVADFAAKANLVQLIQRPLNSMIHVSEAFEENAQILREEAAKSGKTVDPQMLNTNAQPVQFRLVDVNGGNGESIAVSVKNAFNKAMLLEKSYERVHSIQFATTPNMPHPRSLAWAHIISANIPRLDFETFKIVVEQQLKPSIKAALPVIADQGGSSLKHWTVQYDNAMNDLVGEYTRLLEHNRQTDINNIKDDILERTNEFDDNKGKMASIAVRGAYSMGKPTSILVGMRTPDYVNDILVSGGPLTRVSEATIREVAQCVSQKVPVEYLKYVKTQLLAQRQMGELKAAKEDEAQKAYDKLASARKLTDEAKAKLKSRFADNVDGDEPIAEVEVVKDNSK